MAAPGTRRASASAVTRLLLACSAFAVLAAVACTAPIDAGPDKSGSRTTSGTNQPDDEGGEDDGDSPANSKTCLGKAKLQVKNAECTACMNESEGCCEATVACFKDDDDCAALHACMLGCGGVEQPSTPTDPNPPTGNAKAIFTSTVFPKLSEPNRCAQCHVNGQSGATIFMGNGADTTYEMFRAEGFHLANSELLSKGQHAGPPLDADERNAINAWIAAETAAGSTGAGTSTGMSPGACRDKCQADHQGSVAKWRKYNTCAWSTCEEACR